LIKASGINTLLWGGIYNPLIPVSFTNKNFANQLLNLFAVDVLFPVAQSPEIDEVIRENPFLKDPGHYAENIFYDDWHTKKKILGYLDSLNIVNYYWEKEFKNKPKEENSNCILVNYDTSDDCNNLFSLRFGYFPSDLELKDDFQDAFVKGLRSQVINIGKNETIISNLSNGISPIIATSLRLSGYGGTWRGDGLYVGDVNNFNDLLQFWNLRAAGLSIEFLPNKQAQRYYQFINSYLKSLDNKPNSNPNIDDWITVFYSQGDHKQIHELLNGYSVKRRFVFSHCDKVNWNGLNIKPANQYFDWQNTMANIEKNYGRYSVSMSLPEKKFINAEENRRDRNVGFQQIGISIQTFGDFEYPRHSLNPPFIRALNEFYSREIQFDPWKIRSEREGIGVLIKCSTETLTLYPIPHNKMIEKIFELAGYKTKMSQAGLLTEQIIQGMKEDYPIESCRVFKITGVRKLIASQSTEKGKSIKWSDATKIIWEHNFSKFQSLYIESRDRKKLGTKEVFNFLIKKKIFAPKLNLLPSLFRKRKEFKCRKCGLKEKILLNKFTSKWECPFCGFEHFMPSYIAEEFQGQANKYWRFVRSGLFSKDNNQEGAIPVILSLLTFARIFDSYKLVYSTSLVLRNSCRCEIDFCILQYESRDKIQLGIAECKSEGQKINQQDIDNLKSIQDSIERIGIDCYIILSKTANNYDSDEIELFRSLQHENRNLIILSNKELESYHPYWELDESENLPEKYALNMVGMQRNSEYLYLRING
jgi:hypothetical protein